MQVIHTKYCFQISNQVFTWQELTDKATNHWRTAETTTDFDFIDHFDCFITHDIYTDIVVCSCFTFCSFKRRYCNLELSWQESKFWMESLPLTDQFTGWALFSNFSCNHTCILICRGITDT